jgi:beta-galactosidase
MRSEILFNDNWLFYPEQVDETTSDSEFEQVILPHTNKLLPHHSFDDAEYKFISTYRKHFKLLEPLNGRRLFLDFDGAMIATTVTINEHTFEEHKGGYTPFSFDITDYIEESGDNTLVVHLDSTERKDIPPYGYVIDYMIFGGIYRDVKLRYVNPIYIKNVFVKTFDVLTDNPYIEVDVTVQNTTDEDFSDHISVLLGLQDNDMLNFGVVEHIDVPAGETLTQSILIQSDELLNENGEWINLDNDLELYSKVLDLNLWSLDNPYLYTVIVDLSTPTDEEALDSGGMPVDSWSVRFGFRTAEFRDDGFYLNGELLNLIGLNRHQMFPYIGQAAPQRLQERDAEIVKYELGCNIVRTSHYPQSPYFLDKCDEIGLLVFEEIPGWQHIGDKDWQAISIRDVQAMIERDWNHPSIIIWGVRINESGDDTEFYTETNRLAHELDPTRQTGGVRYWQESEFLEDVYTFNDFSNSVAEPVQTPHLITEFNGHMFPTKTWDGEERYVEHAIRHARIQSRQMGMGGVSGAIGWCAFDYNTHQEFGSGDRICYHGVTDIFRNSKWAGSFYGSQQSPEQNIIMQAATGWTMGDRSEGGNNPVTVFSNCDEIEVYMGKALHGKFQPDTANYPHLPHSPFTIPMGMTWGKAFEDLKIIGYYKGEAVAEQYFPINSQPRKLVLSVDHDILNADGADMTWLRVKVTDEHGNVQRYANPIVTFELDGAAELIGTNPFALIGGQAGLLIKATQTASTVKIVASSDRLESASVEVVIV